MTNLSNADSLSPVVFFPILYKVFGRQIDRQMSVGRVGGVEDK